MNVLFKVSLGRPSNLQHFQDCAIQWGVTMGLPWPTAQRNLTVRRTLSVTKTEQVLALSTTAPPET